DYLRSRLRHEFKMRIRDTRLHLLSDLPLHRPALVEHRAVAELDTQALYVHCVVEHVPVARVRWRLVDMEDQPVVPGRDEPRGLVVVYRVRSSAALSASADPTAVRTRSFTLVTYWSPSLILRLCSLAGPTPLFSSSTVMLSGPFGPSSWPSLMPAMRYGYELALRS